MSEVVTEQRTQLGKFFSEHQGGHMVDAILDGHMGKVLAESVEPTYAILELADVQIAFLGGDYNHPSVMAYVQNLSGIWQLFVVNEAFNKLTQDIHRGKWVELDRYAFSSEELDIEHLQQLKSQLPKNFQIKEIDTLLAKRFTERVNDFASHHGKLFDSPEDFAERGIGYCICDGDTIACVASSFAISDTGIEIQIDTRRKYRGNGLATVAAAYLIVDCLEHNLDAGWDAASEISAKLAEKLGYTPQGDYKVVIYTDSRLLVMLRNIIQPIKRLIKKYQGSKTTSYTPEMPTADAQ